MALPTIVGVGAASASVDAITPALPSGVQENDILLLFAESWANNSAMTVSGYEPVPGGAIVNNTRLSVFWKRAGSSESAPTTSDTGDHQIAGIMAVRGCVKKGNPFLISTGGTTAASGTKTATAFTTYIDDVLVINAFAQGEDTFTTGQYSSFTNASLANVTEQFDAFTDLGNGGGFAVSTGEKASAGSVSATTVTCAITTAGMHWTGALIPEMYDGRPIVRAKGAAVANTTAVTPALPVGWQQNDLFLTFVETNNETVTISGWTQAGSSPASNSGANPTRLTVFYKWAGASETAPTTSDSGDHNIAQMVAIRGGLGSGNPFDVTASSAGGTSASVSITGATTNFGNTLVLSAVASTLDGVGSEGVTFSSWANADLTELIEVVDYANASGTGGAIGVAAGYKAVSGAYGATTVTQTSSVEYATWTGAVLGPLTLSAESGNLALAGAEAFLGTLGADEGTLSIAGGDATLSKGFNVSCDAGSFAMTGQPAAVIYGRGIFAAPGDLSLTESASTFDQTMKALSTAATVTPGEFVALVPTPAVSTLSFLVDLVPTPASGAYQRHTERMTVGGTEVAVRSWTYSEQANAVGGSLTVELADVSQRSLFDADPAIVFELGRWDGSAWEYTSLLDTGALRNSQYVIGTNGVSPNDSFTVVAMSETEDRLNTAPSVNTVWYDPLQAEVAAGEIEPVVDIGGVSTAGSAVSIGALSLHDVMERIFVTECGFHSYRTNLPDFRIPKVQFRAGEPYAAVLSGIIGMFEPTYTTVRNGGNLTLCVNDGTVAPVAGIPAGRSATVSNSRFMGIARDASDGMTRIGAIEVAVNDASPAFQYINRRQEVSSAVTGDFGPDAGEYLERETTSHYIDFYDSRYGSEPYRSQLDRVEVDTYRNGKVSGTLIEQSVEDFTFQYGNLTDRFKSVSQLVPDVVAGEVTGSSLRLVSEEYETLSRRLHPYDYGRTFVERKTTVHWGLVYVDTVNQQLDEDYVRDAVSVLRAGNARTDMDTDYRKTRLVEETYEPNRDGTVSVRKSEFDYLADRLSFEEYRQDDGQVGTNAFVGNQRRVVLYPPGGSSVNGTMLRLNAGELPVDQAVALGRRKLALARASSRQFEFELVGADPTIQRGSLISATGRGGEALGTYAVEALTMTGSPAGYATRVQTRSV